MSIPLRVSTLVKAMAEEIKLPLLAALLEEAGAVKGEVIQEQTKKKQITGTFVTVFYSNEPVKVSSAWLLSIPKGTK